MPTLILVPAVMLLVVTIVCVAAIADVFWRRHVGTSMEASLHSYAEVPVSSASNRVSSGAA